MRKNLVDDSNKIYTKHGIKKAQGKLIRVNGKEALAYFDKTRILGYTLIDEIKEEFQSKNIPDITLEY